MYICVCVCVYLETEKKNTAYEKAITSFAGDLQ